MSLLQAKAPEAENTAVFKIPNRIFVGGIAFNVSSNKQHIYHKTLQMRTRKWPKQSLLELFLFSQTTEGEMKDFFSRYGAVRETKIIKDGEGISKG